MRDLTLMKLVMNFLPQKYFSDGFDLGALCVYHAPMLYPPIFNPVCARFALFSGYSRGHTFPHESE